MKRKKTFRLVSIHGNIWVENQGLIVTKILKIRQEAIYLRYMLSKCWSRSLLFCRYINKTPKRVQAGKKRSTKEEVAAYIWEKFGKTRTRNLLLNKSLDQLYPGEHNVTMSLLYTMQQISFIIRMRFCTVIQYLQLWLENSYKICNDNELFVTTALW